jgi:hypothetical protein
VPGCFCRTFPETVDLILDVLDELRNLDSVFLTQIIRVSELGSSEMPRLVECRGTKDHYAALSYCWEDGFFRVKWSPMSRAHEFSMSGSFTTGA